MKKFTHAELAAAQERGDWDLLWQQALPLVPLAIRKAKRSGAIAADDADADLLQQGMLIAGEAVRTWKPIECALSTHVVWRVRGDLFNYVTERARGGIGSYKQRPDVLSLGDDRPNTAKTSDIDGEDGEDDGTFDAALTYAGVVMPGGQYDGDGYVPQGFDDPSVEADCAAKDAIRASLQHLTDEEQDLVCCVFGIGDGKTQTLVEYAAARDIPLRTARRRMAAAKEILALRLENFRH